MEIICNNEKVKDELLYIVKLFYPDNYDEIDSKFIINQDINNDLIITKVSSDISDVDFVREDYILDNKYYNYCSQLFQYMENRYWDCILWQLNLGFLLDLIMNNNYHMVLALVLVE